MILPDDLLTRMANGAIGDSNSSLTDSSVDLLTGQAMSEVYGDLSKFAAGPDFVAKMNLAFGENWDAAGAKALAEGWFQGDFSDIPPMKVVSSAEIGGANGGFAGATDTIYLSKEFLAQNAANPAAVADVLLEEIGHSVDSRLNVTDSPGDEGAIFAAVVQGKELSEGELQGLKSEDDILTITLNNQKIDLELSVNYKTIVETPTDAATSVASNQFGLELAKWQTYAKFYMSDSNPVEGEVINFELTINYNNFKKDIFGLLNPYTVFGYSKSLGNKTTDAVPPLTSWLGVRNGDFVNPEQWTLEVVDRLGSNSTVIDGGKVNVGIAPNPIFNFGGEINLKTNNPGTKFLSIDNYGPYKDNWNWLQILNRLSPNNDTGKFFETGYWKIKGQVKADIKTFSPDNYNWLQLYFSTTARYSYNGAVPGSDTYFDNKKIDADLYALFPRNPFENNAVGGADLSN
ncbi:hypothetical protein QUA03_09550 [Microcoleus sp. S36b_A4]|uniref:hypothetical protein n=1 Tax=Microcoleus sp. S36b_A4 TaxID=3055420 RepID=UPI002FD07919